MFAQWNNRLIVVMIAIVAVVVTLMATWLISTSSVFAAPPAPAEATDITGQGATVYSYTVPMDRFYTIRSSGSVTDALAMNGAMTLTVTSPMSEPMAVTEVMCPLGTCYEAPMDPHVTRSLLVFDVLSIRQSMPHPSKVISAEVQFGSAIFITRFEGPNLPLMVSFTDSDPGSPQEAWTNSGTEWDWMLQNVMMGTEVTCDQTFTIPSELVSLNSEELGLRLRSGAEDRPDQWYDDPLSMPATMVHSLTWGEPCDTPVPLLTVWVKEIDSYDVYLPLVLRR